MNIDWVSTLLGGLIGFLASMGALLAERLWDRAGKIKIYHVLSFGDKPTTRASFSHCTEGIAFVLPLILEIQNTSNTSRVLRDLSAYMYLNGRLVGKLVQVNSSTTVSKDTKTTTEFGNHQSYSFVIPPRSIQREYCSFMEAIKATEKEAKMFNEVRLSYFDERDRKHEFHLIYVDDCWKSGDLPNCDDTWKLLGERHCKKEKPVDTGEKILINDSKTTYLQAIQEPICRMSTISSIFKGFAATIVAGIAALTYSEVNTWVLGLSFVPVGLFALLDIYYLKLEKKYRYLYEQVRTDIHPVDFSMKLTKDNKTAKSRVFDCLLSPSIWMFYPVMIGILVAVLSFRIKGIV